VTLARGTVVLVALDPTTGHEQQGVRPCVIVSDPGVAAEQRYPLLCVVPLSSTPGRGALYPPLDPGKSGLRKRSHALIDQLRSVDKRRVRRVFGRVTDAEIASIDLGLCLYLGIEEVPSGPP
jgi:mRNA interferase MazF